MPGLSDLLRPGGTPRLVRRWKAEVEDHVISLAFAPAGKLLAAAAVSGPIVLFDAATGQAVHTLSGHGFGTTCVSWRHDGAALASAGQDGKVRLWQAATGQEAADLAGGAAWVEQVRWHPSTGLLASAAGKKLRLWSADGALLREYPDQPATIADLAWRPGTRELTSGTYGGVTLWSAGQSEPLRRLEWRGSVLKLAWTPDGSRLAHGNQDATVHYWILANGHDLEMAGYPMKVRELAWDPTGTYLATGGGDRVTVWDCTPPGPADTEPLSFKGHEGIITGLAYQARGPLLASGGQDGKVLLLQPGKFKKALAQSDAGAAVSQLAWSPDDRVLAVGTEAGSVVLYSVG
jgi:WD40 repeat protein